LCIVADMLKSLSLLLVALLAAGSACKKESKDPEAKESADEEEEKKRRAAEVAEDLKKAEEEAAEEAKRWTADLKKQATALVEKKFETPEAALQAIVASPIRTPGNPDRDQYRHPVETLSFFGIKPDMTVVEVGTGAGWYTEILAPLVAREGKLVAVTYDPNGPADSGRTVYGKKTQMFLAKSPEIFGKVELGIIDPPDKIKFGAPGSADLVIAAREMHNWQRRGQIDKYLAAIHQVLKDGGKFGVEQHRAAEGGKAEETAENGYLPQDWLIQKVESAGFKLEAKSEINANPKDTKDYESGVWTLPPSYADGDKDKEKYKAIGESDRMTLRFVKVAGK
jgi:predicted methyltransferase